jgi:uncharacterized damage-inducible protein DinB
LHHLAILGELDMIERKLTVPDGYDPTGNPRIASFAAQLDDRMDGLKKAASALEVKHLEWQPHPGVNTIGMLLAHLAIVDLWWMRLAPRQVPEAESEGVLRSIIGIGMDDDGLPLAAGGKHPQTLSGKTVVDYFRMLDDARAVSHSELRQWRDADLAQTYPLRDRVITREWTVYHVVEHFCSHLGQILLLKHLMRDAGVLES